LSRKVLTKKFISAEQNFQDHKGFVIYDVVEKKNVFEYNSDAYFTPASNTKILTLLAGLRILGDSVPSIKYLATNDSLIFWGMSDPSFLYTETNTNTRVYEFLKAAKKPIYFSNTNFSTTHFGAGWAWDDYNSAYSAERSPFPIYGNCLSVYPSRRTVMIFPSYFTDKVSTGNSLETAKVIRDPFSNQIFYHPGAIKKQEWIIPFRVDQRVITSLLSDTLNRIVTPVQRRLTPSAKTIYSQPVDSLYRVMMQESDNLIAEHLLMMCAAVLSDSLQPEIAIHWMEKNVLNSVPDKFVWVDGSGLSRYNLITPRDIVSVWRMIYEQVPKDRLFKILATGGRPGTLKNWYKADQPYVFGKTGTLSNNHALSGFLVTKSGKILIFCFMNANFTASMNDIRKKMQDVLNTFYEHY
jgi:D-alanyl-D-alanine carboxypeptidase/D-alanyl-D-alanine-endopeptidase (penicillin-binding protein 4)